MERKGKAYRGEGLVVYYDPRLCIHAAECVRGLPMTDRDAKPWIRRCVGRRCGARDGALPHRRLHAASLDGILKPRGTGRRVIPDGPLYIRSQVQVRTVAGALVRADTRMALCRCGASGNKPFCDNSHRAVGFRSA
jgi:hypothetical protein